VIQHPDDLALEIVHGVESLIHRRKALVQRGMAHLRHLLLPVSQEHSRRESFLRFFSKNRSVASGGGLTSIPTPIGLLDPMSLPHILLALSLHPATNQILIQHT